MAVPVTAIGMSGRHALPGGCKGLLSQVNKGSTAGMDAPWFEGLGPKPVLGSFIHLIALNSVL